jgi:histidine ammonia-lyase
MAANSATKLRQVCLNLERLLAIEWMVAAQALDFRRPLKTSAPLEARLSAYRERVPGLVSDRPLHPDIETTLAFLRNNK